MKDDICLLLYQLTPIAKLAHTDGSRAVSAETLLLKHQLIIHSRSRQRAPNFCIQNQTVPGFLSLFLNPPGPAISAVFIKPCTLLSFHNALKKLNDQQLYSPRGSTLSQSPDLTLLDMIMPDLDGLEVCKRLKKEVAKQIPVIFVTSMSDPANEETGLQG